MKYLHLTFIVLVFSGGLQAQNLTDFSKEKGVSLKGNIGTQTSLFHDENGFTSRYLLRANLNLGLFGYNFPLSFVYSDSKADFNEPFSQFKFAPRYKSSYLNAGNFVPAYSPFILQGITIRGAGIGTRYKNYQIELLAGNSEIFSDTVTTDFHRNYALKVERSGTQLKLNSTLFLNQLKNKYVKTPSDYNFAAEGNINWSINEHFSVENRGSMSRFGGYLQLSRHYYANDSRINFSTGNFRSSLQYHYIDPGYNTRGLQYINQDEQKISILGNTALFNRKVQLNWEVGHQKNDLKGTGSSHRSQLSSSLNTSMRLHKNWQIQFMYSGFNSTELHKTENEYQLLPVIDSLKFIRVNRRLSFQSSLLTTVNEEANLKTTFSLLNQQLSETNPEEQANYSKSQYTLNLTCHLSNRSKGWNLNMSLKSRTATATRPLQVDPGINYRLRISEKLILSGSSYLKFQQLEKLSLSNQGINSMLNWKPAKRHHLTLLYQYRTQKNAVTSKIHSHGLILTYQIKFEYE